LSYALFAYGTLEAPEVVELVVGRVLPARPARLHDYARHRVRDQLYPGIVPRPGASTVGTLLVDLDDADLQRLDDFEGSLYVRTRVEVFLPVLIGSDRELCRTAFTYVVRRDCVDRLSDDAWSRERFEADWLPILLDRWRR
jgi:gamma-glutamylcyclotransferase (GGCT)/AIG2-like uncharacterized protein YtfP